MKSASRFCDTHFVCGAVMITLLVVLTWFVAPAAAAGPIQRQHAAQAGGQQTATSWLLAKENGPETMEQQDPAIIPFNQITSTGEIMLALETGDGCRTVRALSQPGDVHASDKANSWLECEPQARGPRTQSAPVRTSPAEVPPVPVLLSPADNSTLNTLLPLLRIDARVSNTPISPNILVSANPNPVPANSAYVVYCGNVLPSSQFQWQYSWNLIPNTRYYWRARSAYGDACSGWATAQWSDWSPTWSFVTGSNGVILPGPQLVSPANNSTVHTSRPTVTWQAVLGAVATSLRGRPVYQIDPSDFGWGMGLDGTATSAQVYRDLTHGETYEWIVTVRNDYAWGPASSVWRFTVQLTSVSGRVTDALGNGIPDVAIADNAGHSTVTDSGGNYTLTGMPAGNYTLTASKAGYTFCPRSRTVSVPPNQAGQDFTGAPAGALAGFCPDPNGFGFPNTQLWRTWPMFEQYYGPAAVRNAGGSICASAQRYFDQTYRPVANGWSCVGFTLAGLHSYQSRPQPNAGPFAIAPHSNLYAQPQSAQLTNPIAFYSGAQLSQQYLNEYQGWLAICAADPNQMVARLQQALAANDPLLLALDAGSVHHAVTPYRVATISPDETHIYVYDSEAPGQERTVRMQRAGSGWQWQYTFAGSLAGAGTRMGGCAEMFYIQASASLEQGLPLVDLCADTRSLAPDSTGQLLSVLPAAGDWTLQDSAGRRLGWAGGQWLAEIPGGFEVPQTASDAPLAQRMLYLPAGAYTVQASAGAGGQVDYSLFADGRVLQVEGQATAGATSAVAVSPGLDAISLTQPAQFTDLALGLVRELPAASRIAGLSASAVTGNAELAMAFDGQALQLSRAGGTMTYRLRLVQPGAGAGYFVTEPITLAPDEAHRLTPANWNGLGAGTVLLEIDEGRDGTVDETVTLENQARSVYLPLVFSN